jgi:hypothetical protein
MTSTITKFDAKDPYNGKTSAFVGLKDKAYGFFEFMGDAPFKVGDEVEYTVTEIPREGQKPVRKIALSKIGSSAPAQSSATPPAKPQIHVGGKSKEEIKSEAAIRMMEAALDGFYRDKLELAHVETKAKEYTKVLWLEIDDLFSSK